MGGVLAEHLVNTGCEVTLVTPAARVSEWTDHTLEVDKINERIYQAGVQVFTNTALVSADKNTATLAHVHSGQTQSVSVNTICLVTSREPKDSLYQSLLSENIETLCCIGDSEAPGTVAAAVYAGHLAARRFQNEDAEDQLLFRRELTAI
jgi:dimethylamine/trimethylamine dehydrogenase